MDAQRTSAAVFIHETSAWHPAGGGSSGTPSALPAFVLLPAARGPLSAPPGPQRGHLPCRVPSPPTPWPLWGAIIVFHGSSCASWGAFSGVPGLQPPDPGTVLGSKSGCPHCLQMARVENTRANGLAVMREHAASDIHWRGGCVADGPGVSCEQEGFTGVLSLGSTWGSPGEIKELTLERPPARLMWLVWVPPGQQGDIEAPWRP